MSSQFIKKHAVEAGAFLRPGYVEQPNGDSVWQEGVQIDHTDIDLQKFAELIVKECTNMLPEDSVRNADGVHMFYAIREHFGISTIGR